MKFFLTIYCFYLIFPIVNHKRNVKKIHNNGILAKEDCEIYCIPLFCLKNQIRKISRKIIFMSRDIF